MRPTKKGLPDSCLMQATMSLGRSPGTCSLGQGGTGHRRFPSRRPESPHAKFLRAYSAASACAAMLVTSMRIPGPMVELSDTRLM